MQLYLVDFVRDMSNIGLHLNAYELISFNLHRMVDMTKLYIGRSSPDFHLPYPTCHPHPLLKAVRHRFAKTFLLGGFLISWEIHFRKYSS